MNMLSTKQFCIIDKKVTETIETKVERAARKFKDQLLTSAC